MVILIAFLGAIALFVITMKLIADKAPRGYENESGFHLGEQPIDSGKIPRCPHNNAPGIHFLKIISKDIYECKCGTMFWFKDCAHWEILTHADVEKLERQTKSA